MSAEVQRPSEDRLPIGGSPLQCKIADAALDLFYSRGARATTVRDIAAACGLSPGALYNHFESKDDLLYVLIRDIHIRVNGEMAEAVASAGPDPAAQLTAIVRCLVTHTASFTKQSRVANRELMVLTGTRRSEISGLRRQMRERLTGILLTGAGQGSFDLAGGSGPDAATVSSATISSMCVHISEWTLEYQGLSLPDLQDRFALMAMRLAGAVAS